MPSYNQYDAGDIWAADAVQRIVDRNALWLRKFLVTGIKAVMKDGRPLFTERISEQERLANLLNAPPAFWDALQAADPESAAALVASVIRARAKGKIPPTGPLAALVAPENLPGGGTDLGLPEELPPAGPPQAYAKS